MSQKTSALQSHFLSSILPYQAYKQPTHFPKSKQFYKPEQFVWNNPHRTSKRLYPYYHQFNDEFMQKVKPEIQKLQEQDRINQEKQRIKRLTLFRNEAREKFLNRQKSRQNLETKVEGERKRQASTVDARVTTQISRKKANTFREHSLSNYTTLNNDKYMANTQYEQNLTKIREMVAEQILSNQKKIRFQFQKRKQHNDALYSNFSRTNERKSTTVIRPTNVEY